MQQNDSTLERSRVRLSDGRSMPQLGFGVATMPDHGLRKVVAEAIATGYRAIDAAVMHEDEVGAGLAAAGLPRDQLFLTTKLWNPNQGYDSAFLAYEASLKRLRVEYVDLYLIHWPKPALNLYVESWKALVRLQAEGRVRSIGVSNFLPDHIERIIGETGVRPVINQIELHPRFQQRDLRDFHAAHGIRIESWSPLGQAQILTDETLGRIARKHGKTPTQIVIRWHLDQGIIAIPKTANPSHMTDNLAVGGFRLDDEDMTAIAALDAVDGRIGPHPLTAPF